jgi:hypothetical protein
MPDSNYYAASASSPTFSKAKLPFSWPSILNPIPRRYRRRLRSKFRSAISPASSIAKIETSFDPRDTIKALRQHRWSYYDGQYLFLIILAIFSLSISQAPGPLMKCAAATALMGALLVPITRQFFLPALPILSWVFLFFNARYVHFLNFSCRHAVHQAVIGKRLIADRKVNMLIFISGLSPPNTDHIFGSRFYQLWKMFSMVQT